MLEYKYIKIHHYIIIIYTNLQTYIINLFTHELKIFYHHNEVIKTANMR